MLFTLIILILLDVRFPRSETNKLPMLPKVPPSVMAGVKMRRMPKRLIDMRGPELVHNKLIHKQFGIQVLSVQSYISTSDYYYLTAPVI